MIFFLLLGAHALLKHIYAKHPPRRKVVKKEEGKATDGTTETLKQKLRKALVDYHPDNSATCGTRTWSGTSSPRRSPSTSTGSMSTRSAECRGFCPGRIRSRILRAVISKVTFRSNGLEVLDLGLGSVSFPSCFPPVFVFRVRVLSLKPKTCSFFFVCSYLIDFFPSMYRFKCQLGADFSNLRKLVSSS